MGHGFSALQKRRSVKSISANDYYIPMVASREWRTWSEAPPPTAGADRKGPSSHQGSTQQTGLDHPPPARWQVCYFRGNIAQATALGLEAKKYTLRITITSVLCSVSVGNRPGDRGTTYSPVLRFDVNDLRSSHVKTSSTPGCQDSASSISRARS